MYLRDMRALVASLFSMTTLERFSPQISLLRGRLCEGRFD